MKEELELGFEISKTLYSPCLNLRKKREAQDKLENTFKRIRPDKLSQATKIIVLDFDCTISMRHVYKNKTDGFYQIGDSRMLPECDSIQDAQDLYCMNRQAFYQAAMGFALDKKRMTEQLVKFRQREHCAEVNLVLEDSPRTIQAKQRMKGIEEVFKLASAAGIPIYISTRGEGYDAIGLLQCFKLGEYIDGIQCYRFITTKEEQPEQSWAPFDTTKLYPVSYKKSTGVNIDSKAKYILALQAQAQGQNTHILYADDDDGEYKESLSTLAQISFIQSGGQKEGMGLSDQDLNKIKAFIECRLEYGSDINHPF